MKKFVDIVSDREIHKVLPCCANEAAWDIFWEMWRDDLTITMSKSQLIDGANGLLTYFNASAQATDVDWDAESECFLWEVEGYESAT